MSLEEEDASGHDGEHRSEEQSPDRTRPAERKNDKTSEKQGGDKDGDKKQDKLAKKSSPWVKIIGLMVVLIAIGAGVYYYLSTKDQESTDDAYTDGRSLTVAPKIAGYVVELLVNDNQRVKAGDVLARIDSRDYIVARDQARAAMLNAQAQQRGAQLNAEIARKNFPARLLQAQGQLQQAQGQLFQAQTDYKRQHAVSREATTQQNVDQSTAQLQLRPRPGDGRASRCAAGRAGAGEHRQRGPAGQPDRCPDQDGAVATGSGGAEPDLRHDQGAAGWLDHQAQHRGRQLPPGRRLDLLDRDARGLGHRELQGKPARPDAAGPDRCSSRSTPIPHLKLDGHVDSIQLGSGSRFTAFPPENATGNFVKIVQRVPVKLIIDRGMDPNDAAAARPFGGTDGDEVK